MSFRHGHTLVSIPELSAALRFSEVNLRRWLLNAGVGIRTGQLVTLADAARTFKLTVLYLDALLSGRDQLLSTPEVCKRLGVSDFFLYQQPVGRVIDRPGFHKRYSRAFIEAVAAPAEEAA